MTANDTEHFSIDELSLILNSEPDFFMDLTVGKYTIEALRYLRDRINYPLGCSPTYDILSFQNTKEKLSGDYILSRLEEFFSTGIDFVCIPYGINKELLKSLDLSSRLIPVTSRTGALLIDYMKKFNCENPFIEYFDQIKDLLKKYRVTLDLADIFRPGCTHDAINNTCKTQELYLQKKYADLCHQSNIGVIIEGGGHLPYSYISSSINEIKSIFGDIPIWCGSVLGTDRAIGKDSVANAIGVVKAAISGADAFLSVSNSEHYSRPTPEQTADAIKDLHVALSIYNLECKNKSEINSNNAISIERNALNWENQIEHSLFPKFTKNLFISKKLLTKGKPCTMCGGYCPLLSKGV